jgi:murein DD-endopeptidase MepM/ murein hydrolase activator NlpD
MLLVLVASFATFGTGHAAPRALPPSQAEPSPALTLAAIDRRLADLEVEEQAAKEELARLGGEIADAHAGVVTRGRAYYRLTRAGLLPLGGGFSELVRHAMLVSRARRGLVSDLSREAALRNRGAELSRLLDAADRERNELTAKRATLDAERLAAQDEQRRQQAFDDAFSPKSGDYVAIYGGGTGGGGSGVEPSPEVGEPTGFREARGRLLFPVVGRAHVRRGRREGTNGPGLEIRAPVGTPVRAVFAGRVAFADRYAPYGNIVILDHGDHYYSVSGNLGSIEAKVGEELEAGDRLGTVGDEGEGAMLYFEIRHGAKTIAPGAWLGVSR